MRNGMAQGLVWAWASNGPFMGALHLPFTVSPGTIYHFGVAVWDYYQTDAPWAVVTLSATSTGTSDPAPASPAFAHAVYDPKCLRGQVKLAWANSSSDETNFKIYRSDNGGAFNLIKTTGADETTYIDKPTNNGPWRYEIYAVKGAVASCAGCHGIGNGHRRAGVQPSSLGNPERSSQMVLRTSSCSASQVRLAVGYVPGRISMGLAV